MAQVTNEAAAAAAAAMKAVDEAAKDHAHNPVYNVQNEAFRLAVAAGAPQTQRPVWPGAQSTMAVVEPIAGLRAAVRMQWAAAHVMYAHVREARGQGVSWDIIGQVLDLAEKAEKDGVPLGELAYDTVVGEPDAWRDTWLGYTCGSCGKSIIDKGPFNGHPRDDERGHADTCQRFLAEIAKHEADNDW